VFVAPAPNKEHEGKKEKALQHEDSFQIASKRSWKRGLESGGKTALKAARKTVSWGCAGERFFSETPPPEKKRNVLPSLPIRHER
jgi:hypothetical protein